MKFRYTAFWFYWPMFLACCAGLLLGSGAIIRAVSDLSKFSGISSPLIVVPVIVFLWVFAGGLVISLGLYLHERLNWLYPARLIVMTERGIAFDLPVGINGFIDWRDVDSVTRVGRGHPWHVSIEFKRKLPLGAAGLEKDLERLWIGGHRLLPSGRDFLDAAARYHAMASGSSTTAEPLSEERHPILRRLAWTFRGPAR